MLTAPSLNKERSFWIVATSLGCAPLRRLRLREWPYFDGAFVGIK
jgi:hypothetical protein